MHLFYTDLAIVAVCRNISKDEAAKLLQTQTSSGLAVTEIAQVGSSKQEADKY